MFGMRYNTKEGRSSMKDRTYLAIDLKSFYASVECIERGLDPLTTNLVVADLSRTEKTICLAVSPSLKAYGIPGRARLFEVIQKVGEENGRRRARCGGFCGESQDEKELKNDPALKIAWLTAAPRMALYLQYSARIHGIYLQYVAPEDIEDEIALLPKLALSAFLSDVRLFRPLSVHNFTSAPVRRYLNSFEDLLSDLTIWKRTGYRVMLWCGTAERAEKTKEQKQMMIKLSLLLLNSFLIRVLHTV